MAQTVQPPFAAQHAQQVAEALRNVADARELMAKAEACGLNCDQRRAMADELETYLTAWREHFASPPGAARRKGG